MKIIPLASRAKARGSRWGDLICIDPAVIATGVPDPKLFQAIAAALLRGPSPGMVGGSVAVLEFHRGGKGVSFAALRKLSGTVEVVQLGRLRQGTGRALETKVQVLLAEPGPDGHFSPNSQTFVREVACGQLCLLKARSRLVDGVLDSRPSRRLAWTAEVSQSVRGVTVLGRPAPYDDTRPWSFLPTEKMENAPQFELECFGTRRDPDLAGSSSNIRSQPPQSIIVPQLELISYLFGVSSRVLLPLFDGVRAGDIARDRDLFDPSNSRVLSDGTVRLVCFRTPSREEAIVGALIVTHAGLRAAYHSVFQTLSVQQDWTASQGAFIDMSYPFQERTTWRFEGRWIDRDLSDGSGPRVGSRFLVTRILDIDFDAGFRKIEVVYPAEATSEGSEGLPLPRGARRVGNMRRTVYVVDRAPKRSRPRAEKKDEEVDQTFSELIEVTFAPDGTLVMPPGLRLPDESKGDGSSSTAGREADGDPDVSPVDVRRTSKPSRGQEIMEVEPGLEAARRRTLEAIRIAAGDDWRIRVLGREVADLGDEAEILRAVAACGGQLLVEVRVGERCLVLADRGSDRFNPRSLGVLLATRATAIDAADLARIVAKAVEIDGSWKRQGVVLEGFEVFASYRRVQGQSDVSKYAEAIKAKVQKVLRPVTPPSSDEPSDASEA